MPNYLLTALIVGLPEAIAAVMICLALLEEKWPLRRTVVAATAILAIAYVFRSLPVAFGTHIIMYAIALAYLLSKMTSAPRLKVLAATAATIILIVLSDTASCILFERVFGIPFQ